MRKLTSIITAAFAAIASAALHGAVGPQTVDLRAVPHYGDSSFARLDTKEVVPFLTYGLDRATPSFTCIFWCCVEPIEPIPPFLSAQISTEPALYVSEGGDKSPDLLGGAYWPVARGGQGATLPLSSTGTWSANCLTLDYDVPDGIVGLDHWQYGCYTINVITDSDLTVTVGGAERNICASNEMQQTSFLCVASDRSITVAASEADAEVSLCVAEAPLRQFHGEQVFCVSSSESFYGYPERSLTNEWRMVVLRGAIAEDGTAIRHNLQTFDAFGMSPIEDHLKVDELWKPRVDKCFARHSRVGFLMAAPYGGVKRDGRYIKGCVWGAKIWPEWLDDDLILAIRDQDFDEMSRRGMSTHYQFR